MRATILKAIEAIGGQKSLAQSLNIHPSLVNQWVCNRRPVAAHHVLSIERITGVSRHDLRPDVFGPPPSNKEEDM